VTLEDEYAPGIVQELHETVHDMQQPVASLLALAAAALTEPDLPATARSRLEQMAGQADWLADMLHCYLSGHVQEAPGDVEEPGDGCADVAQIVNEVIAAECLTWPGDTTLISPTGPVWCALQPVLLYRVVANVLGNAERAAGPTGTVTVEIQQRKDSVMLAVEDNGPGFGRIPSGAGLGLSAVARNVVKYGGKMECCCGVHGGARVTLWLP
jgi:K+-sensing histidine kinase KdpD